MKKKKKPALPKHVRLTMKTWEKLRRIAFRSHRPMVDVVAELIASQK